MQERKDVEGGREASGSIGVTKTALPMPEKPKQDDGAQDGGQESARPFIDRKLIGPASRQSSSPASGEEGDGDGEVD